MPFPAFAGSACCCLVCSSLPGRIHGCFSAELLSSWLCPACTGAEGAWSLGTGFVLCKVFVSPFLWLPRCRWRAAPRSSLSVFSPDFGVTCSLAESVLHPIINKGIDECWSMRNTSSNQLPIGFSPADHHTLSLTDPARFSPMPAFSACVSPAWLKGDYGRLLIALLKSW